MCGRYSLFVPQDTIEERFGAAFVDDYQPRYNAAPSQQLPVILDEAPAEIRRARWGLIPAWGGEGDGLINARAETAAEKPAFRAAWAARPCLVPSTGFYEWRDPGRGSKQPYRIYRRGDGEEAVFAMAGLWEPIATASDGAADGGTPGSRRGTVTILTTEPNGVVDPIHDRMPVVLPRREERTWLTAAADERQALCRPYPDDDLDAYPIGRRVNDPANDDPSVIDPEETEQSGLGQFG